MIATSKICIASDSLFIGEALFHQLEGNNNKREIKLFFYKKDLLDFVKSHKQTLIIVFSRLKDITMHELLDKIKRVSHKPKVILIDSNIERLKYFINNRKDICKGVLFHDIGSGELLHCLNEVANSRSYISNHVRISQKNDLYVDMMANASKLSVRETEIFNLIGNGFSSAQLASKLFISATTVNNHKTNLCNKLDVSRKELSNIASQYREYTKQILH